MKICNHINPGHIFLNVQLPDKDSVFRFIADTLHKEGVIENVEPMFNGLKEREETMSTGIGNGIGLPHTTNGEVRDPIVMLIRPQSPLPFDAIDNLPVGIVIALIIPEGRTALHIQILAGVSRLCKNSEFIKAVREIGDSSLLYQKIEQLESKMAFH
jgi:mannitol/fructose-specific phosphotransferase system IIA component (Ntr-type)